MVEEAVEVAHVEEEDLEVAAATERLILLAEAAIVEVTGEEAAVMHRIEQTLRKSIHFGDERRTCRFIRDTLGLRIRN